MGTDISGKVVDLATYRALHALKDGRTRPPRYLLWYPGVGYFRPGEPSQLPAGRVGRQPSRP